MITTIVTTITMTIMITITTIVTMITMTTIMITAITTIMITAITIIMTTIIMTMITIAAVDTITIITTIIMQMMCLQAGAKRLFINIPDYLLKALSETTSYGTILRSKGIIQMTDGSWKQFDLVPEEYEVREGQPDYTGRICVIGTDLKEDDLLKLFHV